MILRLIVVLVAAFVPSSASAAWHEAKSRHFVIYSDDRPDRLHRYAERLERFDQAARLVLGMKDPPLTESQRLTVYVLKSDSAVGKLFGGSNVAGFYEARADGAFAFVPRRAGVGSIWDVTAEQIFFHEYAHHLQQQFASAAVPGWVGEGFAEFFATAKIAEGGSVTIGLPPRYRVFGAQSPSSDALEGLLGILSYPRTAIEVEQLYGRGWRIVHYLNFEPSRKGQLNRYVEGIQRGMKPLDSAKMAFGDFEQLAIDLREYVGQRKIPALSVNGRAITVGNISVRPLSAGEAAIMDVHIRSRRGVDEKKAQQVVADTRRIAARFPTDPFVQATLAEAEFDADAHLASEAAADRALAADPRRFRALIYKGRSQMEAARKDPSEANWPAIRSWFLRANKQDTESAEPLYLYYESFLAAGARPPKNAIDGLLYAVVLAPQDEELRMMSVHRLLTDGRVAEARKHFEPLAYQPHASDEWRTFSSEMMTAMDAGDGAKALALIEAEEKRAEAEAKSS